MEITERCGVKRALQKVYIGVSASRRQNICRSIGDLKKELGIVRLQLGRRYFVEQYSRLYYSHQKTEYINLQVVNASVHLY